MISGLSAKVSPSIQPCQSSYGSRCWRNWRAISEVCARKAAAKNPATPVALLERLASDKAASVRHAVAENPATPLAVLECLLYDQDVRSAVCSGLSENKPSKNKPVIFAAPPLLTPEERAAAEARLTQDATQFTAAAVPSLPRLLALLSPWTPVPALAKYFRSTWWEERAAIAANPATPPATRAKLAEDGNAVVRATARATLATPSPAA